MNSTRAIRAGVVLLAAGASTRMGRPKLLLPWAGTTVLGHLLQTWRLAGAAQIAAVLAAANSPLDSELARLKFPACNRIPNRHPEKGMFSSIRCAARWDGWPPDLTHWIIALGDQPQIHSATCAELLAFAARHPTAICQPSRNGRPKHPVLLPKAVFMELAGGPEPDLKTFLAAREAMRRTFPSSDPGLDFDLDRPEDYQRAQEFEPLPP